MPIQSRRLSLQKKSQPRRGGAVPGALFYGMAIVIGLIITGVILMFGQKMGWFGGQSTISGVILFTALKPDPEDKGSIRLYSRDLGSTAEYKDVGIEIPLRNEQTWQWENAQKGKNYDLKAALVIDGNIVKWSDSESVTAPASNVDLALKVNWRDLPSDVVSNSDLSIGGQVNVNGYIPSNSQLLIKSAVNVANDGRVGDSLQINEQTVQTISNPTQVNFWQWASAVPLESYMIRAVLVNSSGQEVGESEQIINVEASDSQINLVLNSTAQPSTISQAQPTAVPTTNVFENLQPQASPQPSPQTSSAPSPVPSPTAAPSPRPTPSPVPPPSAKITGTVYLNGPKDNNTSLLLLWKKPGDANFNVVNRYMYPAQEGTSWTFPNAVPGQQYEFQAALQVNNQNTSTAQQPLTVTAPASNVNFTLNTNFSVPTPASQPVFQTCINNNDAIIFLPQIQNAGQYWVQVGSSAGDSSFANTKIPVQPNAGDQKITVAVQRGKQSYVRYAFSECQNCSDNNDFSPWSQTTGFTCE